MDDLISRQAAIAAIEFDITYAKAINKETGEVTVMFEKENKALEDAVTRIKQLPSAQPEIIVCEDCKWRVSENRKTTSLWLPCRALVTPDKFSCIYAERREVME